MQDTAMGYTVAEVRFKEDIRFADMRGQLTRAMMAAYGFEHWIVQQNIGGAFIHNGGPKGQIEIATERVFISRSVLAYIQVNPRNSGSFANNFGKGVEAFVEGFPHPLKILRYGARSICHIPVKAAFSELLEMFRERFISPDMATSLVSPPGSVVEDVGYWLNFENGTRKVRTRTGPMSRKQAIEETELRDVLKALKPDLDEIGIYFDIDTFEAQTVKQTKKEIATEVREFVENHYLQMTKLASTFTLEPSSTH